MSADSHLGHTSNVNPVPAEGESIYGTERRRAWPDYKIDPATGCWNWLKATDPRGYPVGPKKYGIHKPYRIYFFLGTGIDPTGKDVHHKCENTRCVNPAHLGLFDRAEHLRNHKRPKSPLTVEQVAQIKASPLPMAQIARDYGVTYDTVRDIIRGRNWKDVEPAGERELPTCGYCGEELEGNRIRRYCNASHKARARWAALSPEEKARRNAYQREYRRAKAAA